MTQTTPHRVFTGAATVRLAIVWGTVGSLTWLRDLLAPPAPAALLLGALTVMVAVILIASFGVVREAEHLADRLGDPAGSLVLTLCIVLIEVVLIAAVMLGPGEHATVARDSVSAVMMIILGLVTGLAMLIGGRRHGGMRHNRTGTSIFVAMIAALTVLTFVVPAAAGSSGALLPAQVAPVALVTALVYGFFLTRQLGAQAADFREVDARFIAADAVHRPIRLTLAVHRRELVARVFVLVATTVPIVLLSHDLATLLDDGVKRAGAPPAIAGVLIAMIVFAPESITALRAALRGEIQRTLNLCLGAFVSTVGLTVPAVLAVGALTGQRVVLGVSPTILATLLAMVGVCAVTFASPRLTAAHGAVHLTLFAVFALLLLTG